MQFLYDLSFYPSSYVYVVFLVEVLFMILIFLHYLDDKPLKC